MAKSRALTFILSFIFLAFILTGVLATISAVSVLAQDDNETSESTADLTEVQQEQTSVNKAFSWLSEQVKAGWPSSAEEHALALLALSYDDYLETKGKQALLDKKKTAECWAETGASCEIKATALAIVALDKIGEKTRKAENWLLNKTTKFIASNLIWYLQLDSQEETNCTISYDDSEYTVLLHEKPNQKIEVIKQPAAGTKCLSLSGEPISGYWLKIANSNECLGKTYFIDCEKDAKVSMPYQKGNTFFIPSETFSVPHKAEIKTECLMNEGSSTCDYEGTAWAAYILDKKGRNIGTLLPYLVSQSEETENQKYLPDSFLYLITDKPDYAENLLKSKDYNKQGFWRTVKYGKYYSTALASLALKEYFAAETVMETVKSYLLEHQDANGYWDDGNKIKDTSFILYVFWYGKGDIPAIANETINRCEEENYACEQNCSDTNEEVSYLTDFCSTMYGTDYRCCKEKEISSECKDMQDCSDWQCEGKWIDNCKCEYLKETLCDDGCDNDNDGFIDSDDTDCQENDCVKNNYACCHECESEVSHISQYDSACSEGTVCCEECRISDVEICNNKIDDDGDGFIDCKDSDCKNNAACKKSKWWLWVLIIIFIVGGGVGFYLYAKKKEIDFSAMLKRLVGKKEEFKKYKFIPGGGKQAGPARPAAFPARQIQGQQIRQPAGARPLILRRPTKLMPLAKKPEKTETEKQLEKTLKKLEEMGEEEK